MFNKIKENMNKLLNGFKDNTSSQPNKIRKPIQDIKDELNKEIEILKTQIEILEIKG